MNATNLLQRTRESFRTPAGTGGGQTRWRWRVSPRAILLATLMAGGILPVEAMSPTVVMPAPALARYRDEQLPVDANLRVALHANEDARVRAATERLLTTWQSRTGLTFPHTAAGAFSFERDADATLVIEVARPSPGIPTPNEDEAYTLEITAQHAILRAPTTVGALRGLATLTQLLQGGTAGWFLPAASIEDRPRFAWRGLMIDVCRHWQPLEVIERNLDGMALLKLNVLHLHLTEDQGFRIESKTLPVLHERGSDGHYFTQEQIRQIIAYAAARGIRVVPEFDIPGHATSWVVALPEIASAPGPYVIERHWGVFNPVLDPTNEKTYAVLDQFLGEMAALFPDPYLHIGGDENNGVQWKANPQIQAFIREHGLNDNAGLHTYFNRRVRDILQKHGKKLVGWDEILHPDLPKDSVIHSWRGAKGLAAAAKEGFTAILSNGYYIDLNHPAADHYRNDPIPATTTLSLDEQQRILGGEATMWAEWVTPETIDSRIWPRTAAIAERLWSPRETTDLDDMYRRLAIVSARLDEAGLQHERNRLGMIRRFAGNGASPELVRALTQVVDVIEPVKGYARNQQQHHLTQLSPLTGLADMARPESDQVRELRWHLELAAKTSPEATSAREQVRQTLTLWRTAAQQVIRGAATASPRVQTEAIPVATSLSALCDTGLELVGADTNTAEAKVADQDDVRTVLARHKHPGFGVEIPLASALESLLPPAKPLTPP